MPEEKPLQFNRDEDFTSLYANNVQFESSLWDLKMLFGELDQANSTVEQHTAITMAWPQAKIAAYFLIVNVLFHQARNGSIQLPDAVLPTRPNPSDPSVEPAGKKLVEYLAWVHDQFFGSSPFVPPSVDAG